MSRILGLDLGTNSVGWAVVDTEDNNTFTMVDRGVRIFQEGVKIEKGVEGSKAADRTGYRSARRIKFRRKLRKITTLETLVDHQLCPPLTKQELKDWRYKKIYPQNDEFRQWWLTDQIGTKEERQAQTNNPYFYRHLVASAPLDLSQEKNRYMLGRAIYHLAQRRGFLSNRLETTKESDGAVTQGITQISANIEKAGCTTLGQYFYTLYQKGEKIRDHYTHREAHYLHEFKTICGTQQVNPELETSLYKAIFYQRPLKSQKGLIGKCVFEPSKARCATSRPEFEEYRMLCFVNNIKIKTPNDEALRFLNDHERDLIAPQFYRRSSEHFDFEDLAKQLAAKKQYKYFRERDIKPEDTLFNYSMKTTVSGCPVSAHFKHWFGDDFYDLSIPFERAKDGKASSINMADVWHVLNTFDTNEYLAIYAQQKLGFDEDQTKQFINLRLKQDYAALSLKAINKVLPYLRQGLIYSHAVFLANMEEALPKEVWSDAENKALIRKEIIEIIETQNEEKAIVDIVNGLIKTNHEEQACWSEEAEGVFKTDLIRKVKSFYGANRFASFEPEKQQRIETSAFTLLKKQMSLHFGKGEFAKAQRIDERVKGFLTDNFTLEPKALEKLYHPSALDVYKAPIKAEDGNYYLGSPMVASVRNPMAMRAMHQLRKVVNELIKNQTIDPSTKINIEMARGLMNANERSALQSWQNDNEKLKQTYAKQIKEHYERQGMNVEPNEDDILKYQLWEEQKHKCVYTGNEIALSDFLGAGSRYDIEHTIPRSLSFDNSQDNKTLCENVFNRSVKRNKIPYELANHGEILLRIEHWKKEYEQLEKLISIKAKDSKKATDKEKKDKAIQDRHKLTYQRNYLRNKYQRFTMKDVPEGFKNSQLVDTGIITKYAGLYLKTLFNKVYTVKGNTVADFRKMWGLQAMYVKKERVNHIHHCIDAITIACITKNSYEALANYYHEREDSFVKGMDVKPKVDKPWLTFTEDVKAMEGHVLVSHHTPDVLPKQSKRVLRKRGVKQLDKNGKPILLQGDTARGSLHKDTFYGAIERVEENKKGESEKVIKYVVRKPLDTLDDAGVKNIVDDRIRQIISEARQSEKALLKQIDEFTKQLKKAEEHEEAALQQQIADVKLKIKMLYSLPNKNGQPIPINKVRIYQPTVTNPLHIKAQRDKSLKQAKPYKEHYHVTNDGNYLMAIYEGLDDKGKIKRDFEVVNNIDAAAFYKQSVKEVLKPQNLHDANTIVPPTKTNGKVDLPLKGFIKPGTSIILWENNPEEVWDLDLNQVNKRLYKIVGLSTNRIISSGKTFLFGTIVMKHQQEARPTTAMKIQDGAFKKDELYIPYRKMSHNQFDALIEHIDFIIDPLGKIKKTI